MKNSTAAISEKPKFRPRTELGKKLWARRQSYIANGGKLITWDELDRELAERKGRAK